MARQTSSNKRIQRRLRSEFLIITLSATSWPDDANHQVKKISEKGKPIEESGIESTLEGWVRLPNGSLKADETLDLADLLGTVFTQMTRHNADGALRASDGLAHPGLYSLARLAIIKGLLEELKNSPRPVQKRTLGNEKTSGNE